MNYNISYENLSFDVITLSSGIWIITCCSKFYISVLGYVSGIPTIQTSSGKKIFEVYNMYVEEPFRRNNVMTFLHKFLFESYDVLLTFTLTEFGKNFCDSLRYQIEEKTGLIVLTKDDFTNYLSIKGL